MDERATGTMPRWTTPATGWWEAGTIHQQAQASPEFGRLRSRLRRFVFPMTAFFLAWYLGYVVLAAYAPGFMAIKVAGNVTVGLAIGLAQFLSTFVITTLYVRYADRKLDPVAERLRGAIEREL